MLTQLAKIAETFTQRRIKVALAVGLESFKRGLNA